MVALTGQPTKGRANDGGMRIGEMERDAITAHGLSTFLKESYVERSDGSKKFAIDSHGRLSHVNTERGLVGSRGLISRVTAARIPGAFKLLVQEMQMMHIELLQEVARK
jgi:DNA-directed RNA polymerase beta subunit